MKITEQAKNVRAKKVSYVSISYLGLFTKSQFMPALDITKSNCKTDNTLGLFPVTYEAFPDTHFV